MTTTKTATTLTNSFHNTSYRTLKTREELDAIAERYYAGNTGKAEMAFIRKIRSALCGMAGCRCGETIYGERR